MTATQDDLKTPGFEKLKNSLMNENVAKLTGLYRGVVTRCKTDNKKSQYIRVKIFGVTDDLPSKAQPWARGSGTHAVPDPGTYVDITFENGDIHFPVWGNPAKAKGDSLVTKGQKQSRQQNQEMYNSQDGTTISYDKSTGVYTIDHSSGAKFTIDNDGVLSHKSGPMGIPLPTYPVLTEASICLYTGGPHACGSKYMKASALPIG